MPEFMSLRRYALPVAAIVILSYAISFSHRAPAEREEDAASDDSGILYHIDASVWNSISSDASHKAFKSTAELVGGMVDAAYMPVFSSVTGQRGYGFSGLGGPGALQISNVRHIASELRETLFVDLDQRLDAIGKRLDERFNIEFQREIKSSIERQRLGRSGRASFPGDLAECHVMGERIALDSQAGLKPAYIASEAFLASVVAEKMLSGMNEAVSGNAGDVTTDDGDPGISDQSTISHDSHVAAYFLHITLKTYLASKGFDADLRGLIDERKIENKSAFRYFLTVKAVAIQAVIDDASRQQAGDGCIIRTVDAYPVSGLRKSG